MADYRTRNRSNSIFYDDDRGGGDRWRSEEHGWRGNSDRGQGAQRKPSNQRTSPDDRGFFERAGDEVRSWFGNDEAERRRELDSRQHQRETPGSRARDHGGQEPWANRDDNDRTERNQLRSNQPAQHRSAWHEDEQGGFGDGGFGGVRQAAPSRSGEQGFGSHHDEAYRRWRDAEIASLDREYDEYRSHRRLQFEQDFSTFRQSRQSQITSGGSTLGQTGEDRATKMSTRPAGAGASAQQSAGDLTTGTETVTAEPASESGSRSARNR